VRQRRLGRSGLAVSEIGLGTMTFGSMADEATALRCLDKAFDAGVLSGKYLGGAWPEGARMTRYRDWSPRTKIMTDRFVNERTLATAARVAELARECGLSPVTFSVAWTLTRDFLGAALVGVTHPDQLDEHLRAAEVVLPEDALAACDRIAKEIRYPME
jgi:aryl-alcohol dehydrogenase-like predicted oxidoreductase